MAGKSPTEWVLQIGDLLRRDDLQTSLQTPTSIFKLSDSVTQQNPDSFSPSLLLLGPLHHFPPQLHKMEILKLQTAKNLREKLHLPEFTHMVDELKQLEIQIRSSYEQNFDMDSEALAWRMLIDGLFLLQLLGISNDEEEHNKGNELDHRLHFHFPVFAEQQLHQNLDNNVTKTQKELVNDLLKLENQIPLHVLKTILPENLRTDFQLKLFKFCVSVSPLPLPPFEDEDFRMGSRYFPDLSKVLDQSQHLLHFLYSLIFYERLIGSGAIPQRTDGFILMELLNLVAKVIDVGILQQLVQAVGLIQSLFGLLVRVYKQSSSEEEEEQGSSLNLPSASDLRKVRVKFEPIISDEEKYRFDEETATLKLPIITINAFSEVILRNLVAFESAAKLNPPFLSHYVMLMSGLIVTGKDVGVLKRCGIIAIVSGDDEDVVKLFKSLRNLQRVDSDELAAFESCFSHLELRAMEEMKVYYESCWRIKAERFVKRFICPVFQALVILVIVLLIAIVAVRTVCGWFSCPKIFGRGISASAEALINGGDFLL